MKTFNEKLYFEYCSLWIRNMLKNGKAVPLQAWTSPEGSRKLKLPDFVTTAQDGGRLSALRTGRLYPQEILPVFISVGGWKDFMSMKNPLTPVWIEPATIPICSTAP